MLMLLLQVSVLLTVTSYVVLSMTFNLHTVFDYNVPITSRTSTFKIRPS